MVVRFSSLTVHILAASALMLPFNLVAPARAANPEQVQQLLKTNQCPRCDLSGADLSGMNLFGANLAGANLNGAKLNRANLGFANLLEAYLKEAQLQDTYLYMATLTQADLSKANLNNAFLREAIVADARFSGADLSGANLSGVNLAGVNLSGVNLSGANLSGAIFRGPILRGFTLSSAFLSRPEEDQANLENANLSGANLQRAMLSGVNLKGATLDGADLQDAVLERAILEGASLRNVKNANLQDTFQSEVEAKAAPFQSEAKMTAASMARAQQAYYVENQKFARKLPDLMLGIKPESKHYRYQVVPQKNAAQSVMMVAQAKAPGFKSYTVALFAFKKGQSANFVGQICETDRPSTSPPAMPSPPKNSTATVTCPTGSRGLSLYPYR